jgi:PHD/YefM family antitoxin component YafN of YafNO toxin-antitoxin module
MDEGDEVIVERQGRPQVVILSFAEYEKVQELRERQRRQDALEQLRRLRDEISAQTQDLTPEQIEEIAERVGRDAVRRVREKAAARSANRGQ